ncbi:MAG TPA: amidase [Acidobacteriaceae bacterium]|nr:amidase [Acidobacteriaceae bacterium]
MDLAFSPAWRLAELTRAGKIGCLELLDHCIDRVERFDARIGAVVVRDFTRARVRARMLDQNHGMKSAPLFGVPMTVKESFDLKNHPTTWGLSERENHRAEQDAVAVQRIEKAGAVVFGKTNVPVSLADWQAYNPVYGATSNPWNLAYSPGGSSGGAAAAVAAGFSGLEIGSDIGGSIRVPAHFCGIFGHKSTWGLCPMRGHSVAETAAPDDINVLGPLARSARDLQLALDSLCGPDTLDTGLVLNLPKPRARRLQDLRIAVWSQESGQATSNEITAAIEALAMRLERDGAEVSRTARPAFDSLAAYRLYVALLEAALSAWDSEEESTRKRTRKAQLRLDDMGTEALTLRATNMTHHEWLRLNEERHKICHAWAQFFDRWDVLLCPAFAVPALPHMQKGTTWERSYSVDGREIAYNDMLFWPGITCGFYLPASVAPVGKSSEGLPIGVQIVGPLYGDRTTIQVAAFIEQMGHGFVAPPGWE